MREYHSLFVDGNFIAVADVEKVSLRCGAQPNLSLLK
jgi:hypothetical protein